MDSDLDDESIMVTPIRWLYNNEIRAFNRVFRLGLSNGKDVIARIPFLNAGPKSLLTRSEVATMDFVRSRLGAPVPKVLAWDATSDNSVGCEYVVMEKCDGPELQSRSDSTSEAFRYVYDIAELMSDLASIRFSQYGSVYYKEDVDSHLQERPLYAEGEKPDEYSERFRIGPSAARRFYRGGRAHLSIDRGPWKDINSYINAIVRCEMGWIQMYAESPQAQNQLGARHSAEQHISLLQKWLSLAPAVLPTPEYCIPTLSHPDLNNIFVTDDDPISVAWIIDWQGAAVQPLFETETPKFLSVTKPSNLKYVKIMPDDFQQPVLPDNFKELTADEKQEACKELLEAWPEHAFFKVVGALQRPLLAVLRLLQMEYLRRAIYYSSYSWSDGLPLLEQCLIRLSAEYGTSIPMHSDYLVCPVVFSEDDMKRHTEEFHEIIFKEEMLDVHLRKMMEQDGIFVHPDGSVKEDDFEAAVKKAKDLFDLCTKCESKEDAEKMRRRWPMREGKFVLSMESWI